MSSIEACWFWISRWWRRVLEKEARLGASWWRRAVEKLETKRERAWWNGEAFGNWWSSACSVFRESMVAVTFSWRSASRFFWQKQINSSVFCVIQYIILPFTSRRYFCVC